MKFVLLFTIAFGSSAKAERIRRIVMTKDQIAKVNTAVGVATIIQVPDQPTSLVVGNQDGFKVEFLDTAITIKPLSSSAKSNLYIYTDYRRFDVQLSTVTEPQADYVVYLEEKRAKAQTQMPSTKWTNVSRKAEAGGLALLLTRVGRFGQSRFLDFQISSRKEFKIKPEWIWITQDSKTIPIQRLVISSFQGNVSSPVRVIAELIRDEFKNSEPIRIEVRAPAPLRLNYEWK